MKGCYSITGDAQGLLHHTNLASLNLEGCTAFTRDLRGLCMSLVLSSSSLTYLNVRGLGLRDSDMRAIGNILIQSSASRLGHLTVDKWSVKPGGEEMEDQNGRLNPSDVVLLAGILKAYLAVF